MAQKWRLYILTGILGLAALGLVGRMLDLAVLQHPFLLKQSNARILRNVPIDSNRGIIMDRHGQPLAVSVPVSGVWINPEKFNAKPGQLTALAQLLNIPAVTISATVAAHSRSHFVYLKRGVPPSVTAHIRRLKIAGVFFEPESRRYYPDGAAAAQVVGFTNVDGKGVAGLELEFDKWMRGKAGEKRVVKDRRGQVIANVDELKKPVQGKNLVLGLDSNIQYLAYHVLQKAVAKYHAKSGSVVVLQPKTGEILAMANVPSYNPNNRPSKDTGQFRNRAVTDQFEPGSTMKAFSVASALETGKYTPKTIINTSPGWMMIGGHTIKDDSDNGVIDVTQVVQRSSNVGVSKMTLSLPPEHLWSFLTRLGFGVRTTSGFPGEVDGSFVHPRAWRKIKLATVSFGYGIAVTALQLAHAYSIIADHGMKIPVTFLDKSQAAYATRVIPEKVANQMLTILEAVLNPVGGGTGFRARIPGYYVAGKTGTAYIVGPHGYSKTAYNASFIGIAPVTNPQLVVAVIVHDVQGKKHFGGQVSAPAFAQIMAGALRLMDVAPDHVS